MSSSNAPRPSSSEASLVPIATDIPVAAEENNNNSNNANGNDNEVAIPTDIDDMIGDLIKEELQLVMTRMIRNDPNLIEVMKPQLIKVLKSRSRQTPPPMSRIQQFMMMAPQQQQQMAMLNPAFASPEFMPFMGMGMGMGMRQQHMRRQGVFAGGDETMTDALPTASSMDSVFVDVRAIRRKIRSAFQPIRSQSLKKRSRYDSNDAERYRLDMGIIRAETKVAKEAILSQGDLATGLKILEAVTSEYVNCGTEFGEQNVECYDDMLKELANDWVEVFLSDHHIDQQERAEWENKLKIWDKSASEEEGTFSTARYAAKLGWQDTHLKHVLEGDHIGKFKEPQALSVARLNILERENKHEQGLNLAKAVDMNWYTARFLLKLNRLDEATETVYTLEDPQKAFSIAQLARPIAAKVAFDMCIHSIAAAHAWSHDNDERSRWLVDLSLSSQMLDTLVEAVEQRIKHKTIQFNIAKLLKEKEQFQTALNIGKYCIQPFKEPRKLFPWEEPKINPLTGLPEIDPGTIIPAGLCYWLWELSYEMLELELGTKESMDEVLELILNNVTDVDQLIQLIQLMNTKKEYELILKVGEKCLQLLEIQKEESDNNQKTQLKQQIEQCLLLQQQPALQQQQQQQQQQYLLDFRVTYIARFDKMKHQVAQLMLNAALDSKIIETPATTATGTAGVAAAPAPAAAAAAAAAAPKPKPYRPMSQEKIKSVVDKALEHVKDITHMIQLAQVCKNRLEYELALSTGTACHERIVVLRKEYAERQELMQELHQLQVEQQDLLLKQKTLEPFQQERMRELEYQREIFKLLPPSANYTPAQYDNLNLSIAKLMMETAIDSTLSLVPEQRLPKERLEAVADTGLEHLNNPYHLVSLAQDLANKSRFVLVLRVGYKLLERVSVLREKFAERERVRIPLSMLQQDQQVLLLQKPPKQLEQAQLDKMQQLEAKLKEMPVAHYDPHDINQYEMLDFQISKLMIISAVNSKLAFNIDGKLEQLNDQQLEEVVNNCLKYVQRPDHMLQFADDVQSRAQWTLALHIGQLILERIVQCLKESEERELQRQRYQMLLQEESQLATRGKQLEPADKEKLREMQLEQSLLSSLLPSYCLTFNSNKYDQLRYQAANSMISAALDSRNELEQRIANRDPNTPVSIEVIEEEEKNLVMLRNRIPQVVAVVLEHVKDPSHLYDIANSLKARSEFDLVLQFSEAAQARIIEVLKEQESRAAPLAELEALQQELEQLNEQKKKLGHQRKMQDKLPQEKQDRLQQLLLQQELWKLQPSYINTKVEQFDKINLNIAQLMITTALDALAYFEEQVKIQAPAVAQLSEEEKEEKRRQFKANIDRVLKIVDEHVKNPNYIIKNAQLLQGRAEDDIDLVLQTVRHCQQVIDQCRELKEARDLPQQKLTLLEEEQTALEAKKKSLTAEQQQELERLQAEVDALNAKLPYYANATSQHFDNMHHSLVNISISAVFNCKRLLESKMEIEDWPLERIKEENQRMHERIREVLVNGLDHLHNPEHIIELAKTMRAYNETEFVIMVGEKCQEVITQLDNEREAREEPHRQLQLLQQEQTILQNQRKELRPDQQELMRQLQVQFALISQSSPYVLYEHNQYDKLQYQIGSIMISAALDAKAAQEEKMQMDSQVQDEQIEEANKRSNEEVRGIISKVLQRVTNVNNLVQLTRDMSQRKEYELVLQCGVRAEERIDELRKQLEERLTLEKKKEEIEAAIKLQPQLKVEKEDEIKKIDSALLKLPLIYDGFAQLDKYNLDVANMMINAAKIEEDNDVLREQSIVMFKIKLDSDSFETVRNLTAEDEWDAVKKQLLDHVVRQYKLMSSDQQSFNSKSVSAAFTIELLLDEGLYKDCIKIFPEPPRATVQLLTRLWLEAERNNDTDASKLLLPTVEAYVKHSYQEFNFDDDDISTLLDSVQTHDAGFVVAMFNKLIDSMMMNVVPKQYQPFVDFLKLYKKRATDMKREADFEKAVKEFKKQHKGKKKLMQLVQMADL